MSGAPAADRPLLGAIEAGGTKFVLAVGRSPGEILARHSIPTTTPAATLGAAAVWLTAQGPVAALGIASFGPAGVDPAADNWGHILNTPKPGWADCAMADFFAQRLAVPIGFDTDVGGAGLAEAHHGAGRGTASMAYVTVGTGIGGALIVDGRPVHGIAHGEMGHIFPRRAPGDEGFAGLCPHHGDCLEGLAAGPAIKARWGASLSDMPADHPSHAIIADYLAQLCHSLFALSACELVVLGGGVSKTPGLIARIAERAQSLDRAYLPGGARHRICAPELGDDAGITGALMLADGART